MSRKVRKAVIPAAGLATRFFPVTKSIPKGIIPILDTPMIQYVFEEAVESGIEEIILISSQASSASQNAIQDYFSPNPLLEKSLTARGKKELAETCRRLGSLCKFTTVIQQEPLGLGHAVLQAEDAVGGEPFAVLLSDEILFGRSKPVTAQLIELYQTEGRSVVAVMEVLASEVHKYGIVSGKTIREGLLSIDRVVEKPSAESAPSRYALPGRYVFDPKIFKHLRSVKPSRGGEIQLTDGIESLAQSDGVLAFAAPSERFDTGNPMGYLDATLAFALKRPEFRERAKELIQHYAQKK